MLPTKFFYEDNLATLNYAYKANNIVNSIKRHEDPGFDLISRLRVENSKLLSELDRANKQISIMESLMPKKLDTSHTSGFSSGELDNTSTMYSKIYEKLDNFNIDDNQDGGTGSRKVAEPHAAARSSVRRDHDALQGPAHGEPGAAL